MRYLMVCSFFIVGFYLVGCSDQLPPDDAVNPRSKDQQQVFVPPNRIRLPLNGALDTIDPGLTEDTGSIEVVEQLFLGLTSFDHITLEVLPELADSWTSSDEGTTYLFHLREDARWSNGEPIIADDFVWALRRNIAPITASPYAYMLFILENARELHEGKLTNLESLGVRALSDSILEFRLAEPASYFPAMVAVWTYRPLPRAVIEEFGTSWTEPQNIVTSGAYQLVSWKRNTNMVLEKNPYYYEKDKVSIQEIEYIVVQESSIGLLMYENDALDVIGDSYLALPPAEIPRILADPVLSQEYRNGPSLCTYYYGFNTQRPPLDNPLVRKAISASIDRQLLIDVVTQGNEEPAHTFTRPPIFGSVDPADGLGTRFNPEMAKAWLAEAGYPDGKGFPVLNLAYNRSETHHRVAQAITTFLSHYLNIVVESKALEWGNFMDSLDQPNTPDMFKFGWCADYPDANNWLNEVFHPTDSANRTGWQSPEFEMLVELARSEPNPERRKIYYRRAERILVEEQVAIMPLFFHTAQYLVKPRVKNWYHMPLGGQQLHDWGLK